MDRAARFDGVEQFNNDHTTLVTGGAFCQGSTREFLVLVTIIPGGLVVRRLRRRHREKLTTTSELLLAVAIGQEAVVADALKALGQNV